MKKIPKQCNTCKLLHTEGMRDGKHNRWCCKYGKPSYDAISHCTLHGGYEKSFEK